MNADTTETQGRFREWAIFVVPAILVSVLVCFAHYWLRADAVIESKLQNEAMTLDLGQQILATNLGTLESDTRMLLDLILPAGQQQMNQAMTEQQFVRFARHRQQYSQIRFIDASGQEQVRVENDLERVTAIAGNRLQNKSQRYYVRDIGQLAAGEFYISPLDLNIEFGRIQIPHTPVIRIGIPVFIGSQRKGSLLINYRAQGLFDSLKRVTSDFSNQITMVNDTGFWQLQSAGTQSWLYSEKLIGELQAQWVDFWPIVRDYVSGQNKLAKGYLTWNTFYLPENSERSWKLISTLPESQLKALKQEVLNRWGLYYFLLIALFAVTSGFMAGNRYRYRVLQGQVQYEQGFRQILENIQLSAITVDKQGVISFANSHFLRMIGESNGQFLGRNYQTLIVNKDQMIVTEMLGDVWSGHRLDKTWSLSVNTEKGPRLLRWTLTASKNGEGKTQSITLLGRDITEREVQKQQLLKLSHVIEQSPSIVMITDTSGLIEYVNPTFTLITGYELSEVIGQRPSILSSGETSSEDYQALWSKVGTGKIWEGEFHNRKKSGELYWESAAISAVRDEYGKNLFYVAVKQDITEQKHLQKQINQQQKEKVQYEKLAAVGRMAAMMAHDLRNPLSSVKIALKMLTRKAFQDEQAEELTELALEQVDYMDCLMEDILSYSRQGRLSADWFDPAEVVRSAVLGLEGEREMHGVELQLDDSAQLPTIFADPVKIRLLLQNLIQNAVQAASEEKAGIPKVSIKSKVILEENGPELQIEILNNGQSFDPELSEQVFEPFFTTRAKGTGLGLAIVRQVLDSHNGSIRMEPLLSGGTKVCVQLPLNYPQSVKLQAA
ncbi:hypothetical protein EOPP23_03465 [Endozoicomonas sp. OPT23]|uniref:PAS domain S-box protein n=1 Tax=Endozoicomonas sp. OPT23 TaxID=2072845 RepID=UPI00129A42F8|nr:PAS domain S-box protein [Endozoicomonas sp. OPT23]MRI32058.1 hypothetical protein [Endozoicomonas sp. OPT23]